MKRSRTLPFAFGAVAAITAGAANSSSPAVHALGFSGFAGAGWITAAFVPIAAFGWAFAKTFDYVDAQEEEGGDCGAAGPATEDGESGRDA